MKKTFTTIMPDKVGVFKSACEIIKSVGLNITRVSYNKAVDVHMLFLEVDGQEESINLVAEQLKQAGYVSDQMADDNVILLEFTLRDVPGAVYPILDLISQYQFNISYMSSRENGTPYQYFRIGMIIEDERLVSDFIQKASRICETKIVQYNKCELVLDNTVFYVSFANQIAAEIGLDKEQKTELIVNSNLIMEELRDKPQAQFRTFDYIRQFSNFLSKYHGEKFAPKITTLQLEESCSLILLEPPCGSNTAILRTPLDCVCIDGGLCCYATETMSALRQAAGMNAMPLQAKLILTHADVDHCGLAKYFSTIYASQPAVENFRLEAARKDNLREQTGLHAPYVRISKLLSDYRTPDPAKCKEIYRLHQEEDEDALFHRLEDLSFYTLRFEVWEGRGGHVRGEIILVERQKNLVFTGDIFVNTKELDDRQKEFNCLAPYLMTSVDTDPQLARQERQAFREILGKGKWTILPGHGHLLTWDNSAQ